MRVFSERGLGLCRLRIGAGDKAYFEHRLGKDWRAEYPPIPTESVFRLVFVRIIGVPCVQVLPISLSSRPGLLKKSVFRRSD